jgi:uncharacterized protein YegL
MVINLPDFNHEPHFVKIDHSARSRGFLTTFVTPFVLHLQTGFPGLLVAFHPVQMSDTQQIETLLTKVVLGFPQDGDHDGLTEISDMIDSGKSFHVKVGNHVYCVLFRKGASTPVLLVLDCSGSMGAAVSPDSVDNEWVFPGDTLKTVQNRLAKHASEYGIAFLAFTDTVTPFRHGYTDEFARINGGTNFSPWMREAFKWARECPVPGTVFASTDGQPYDVWHADAARLREVAEVHGFLLCNSTGGYFGGGGREQWFANVKNFSSPGCAHQSGVPAFIKTFDAAIGVASQATRGSDGQSTNVGVTSVTRENASYDGESLTPRQLPKSVRKIVMAAIVTAIMHDIADGKIDSAMGVSDLRSIVQWVATERQSALASLLDRIEASKSAAVTTSAVASFVAATGLPGMGAAAGARLMAQMAGALAGAAPASAIDAAADRASQRAAARPIDQDTASVVRDALNEWTRMLTQDNSDVIRASTGTGSVRDRVQAALDKRSGKTDKARGKAIETLAAATEAGIRPSVAIAVQLGEPNPLAPHATGCVLKLPGMDNPTPEWVVHETVINVYILLPDQRMLQDQLNSAAITAASTVLDSGFGSLVPIILRPLAREMTRKPTDPALNALLWGAVLQVRGTWGARAHLSIDDFGAEVQKLAGYPVEFVGLPLLVARLAHDHVDLLQEQLKTHGDNADLVDAFADANDNVLAQTPIGDHEFSLATFRAAEAALSAADAETIDALVLEIMPLLAVVPPQHLVSTDAQTLAAAALASAHGFVKAVGAMCTVSLGEKSDVIEATILKIVRNHTGSDAFEALGRAAAHEFKLVLQPAQVTALVQRLFTCGHSFSRMAANDSQPSAVLATSPPFESTIQSYATQIFHDETSASSLVEALSLKAIANLIANGTVIPNASSSVEGSARAWMIFQKSPFLNVQQVVKVVSTVSRLQHVDTSTCTDDIDVLHAVLRTGCAPFQHELVTNFVMHANTHQRVDRVLAVMHHGLHPDPWPAVWINESIAVDYSRALSDPSNVGMLLRTAPLDVDGSVSAAMWRCIDQANPQNRDAALLAWSSDQTMPPNALLDRIIAADPTGRGLCRSAVASMSSHGAVHLRDHASSNGITIPKGAILPEREARMVLGAAVESLRTVPGKRLTATEAVQRGIEIALASNHYQFGNQRFNDRAYHHGQEPLTVDLMRDEVQNLPVHRRLSQKKKDDDAATKDDDAVMVDANESDEPEIPVPVPAPWADRLTDVRWQPGVLLTSIGAIVEENTSDGSVVAIGTANACRNLIDAGSMVKIGSVAVHHTLVAADGPEGQRMITIGF